MIEITFVRHGQTQWNKERRIQGVTDIPLNTTGIKEAEFLKKHITKDYDFLISSPLKRAYRTAEILNEKLDMKLETNELLVERNFGTLAGQQVSFVKANSQECPIIEAISQMESRLLKFLEQIKIIGPGRFLVVTHGGVISTLLNILSGGSIDWENTPISNCSLTRICFDNTWSIDFINRDYTKIFV